MERRFGCVSCGKCCFGWLPLTMEDALNGVGRFPLAMVWTPVPQASRAFAITERLGTAIRTRDKRKLAVRVTPTAYIPPTMPCPALSPDNLCGLQAEKPSRCRAMPFFAAFEERDQARTLIPRPGWRCDTSSSSPVVYRGETILDRADFDAERAALLAQAPVLRAYAERLLAQAPGLGDRLAGAAMTPGGGHVAVGFASLLRHLEPSDRGALAATQISLLNDFADRVAGEPKGSEYQRNYGDWAWELERLT